MTTVDLLRETLDHDAEAAATPDRVAVLRSRLLEPSAGRTDAGPLVIADAAGRRPRRVRPLALALSGAAAAAVAVLVVALFVAGRPGGGSAPAATGPAATLPLDTWGFTVDPDPTGLHFSYVGTGPGVQGGFWKHPGDTGLTGAALTVAVSPVAGQIPARPANARPVTVGTSTGWSAPWDDTMNLQYSIGASGTLTVWRDDSGLWFGLVAVGDEAPRAVQLATSVHAAAYHPVRVPATLGWLPSGPGLYAVSESDGSVQFVFGPHADGFQLGITSVGSTGVRPPQGSAASQPLIVGRFHGEYRSDDPVTVLTDGRVDIAVTQGNPAQVSEGLTSAMPLDTLTQLLAGLTVADLHDPSTWTDLAAALPS